MRNCSMFVTQNRKEKTELFESQEKRKTELKRFKMAAVLS